MNVAPALHPLRIALLGAALMALLALMPASAHAALFRYESAFGSATAPDGRFPGAAGVATDAAGRVYVADPVAGRLDVYDNATDGNRYLLQVGQGVLVRPVGVVVDVRGRIYVTDAGRDVVVMFDALTDGGEVRREFGGPGSALGQLSDPRYLVVDRSSRVYVTERTNARVQWFRPVRGNKSESVAAFGFGETTFLDPEGLARDADTRLYVADESADGGEVRVFDPRGYPLRTLAASGSGAGQVAGPRGLVHDPIERLVVIDSANARLQAFAPYTDGSRFLEAFGAAGSGPGQFDAPSDAALAPGALMYVTDTGNGRIVRLRYDDADLDSVLDSRENCRGLANSEQRDTDRDGFGDDCDPDDDNDAVGDSNDRCQRTLRGADANGDGCGDPTSRISGLRERATYTRGSLPNRVRGRAAADELGVEAVRVAIGRVDGRRCRWFTARGRLGASGRCTEPVFFTATGTERFSVRLRGLRRGTYRVISRAVQKGGLAERRITRRNSRTFRVR